MRVIAEKLEAIYGKYGGKAIYPPLFIFFFLLNFLTSFGLSFPATDPNELSVIAEAKWFTGSSWSGVMCSVNYYYGFFQALIYAPVMLVLNDAHLQYTAIQAINAALISLVPMLAFSCAGRLGAGRVWRSLLTAIVSGGYCCYFAHAKFAWSETSAIVFPWLMLYLLLRAEELKSKPARGFYAVMFGICCGFSLSAHSRLLAVVLAVLAALLAQRLIYKKSAVPLFPFSLSFVLFCLPVKLLAGVMQESLWMRSDPNELNNTVENFLTQTAEGFMAENGISRFVQTLFGQLYYFVTATWGAGAVAVCLFFTVCARCIRSAKAGEEAPENDRASLSFGFFTFFSVALTVIIGTLYRFSSDGIETYQDTMLFGRFLDGVIPFALMFVLIVLFKRSIELKELLGALAVLGVIYLTFFGVTLPTILNCRATRISPILALYPLQIGRESNSLLSFESLLLSASMTFCVMALLIVIISSARRTAPALIAAVFAGLTVYSAGFMQAEYIPLCRSESERKNEWVEELSKSVYDQNGAPTLTAYNLSRHEALMLQFINQNVTVRITYDIEAIPENCFLAVKSSEDVSALFGGRTPFLLVAENSVLRLYAYGERAIAYMTSQDIGENEDESQPLITEKPVSQSTEPTEETAPPGTTTTTAPPATERTTERTPIISTQTTPAVVTVPADALGTGDDWVVIE